MDTSQPASSANLGSLCNPHEHLSEIELMNIPKATLLHMMEQMMLIRTTEEQIGKLVESQEARCPCHLAIGQEAVPVGISQYLNSGDRMFGAHRSHGHYIAAGGSVEAMFAEVLGKEAGCSKGMGGSMHLISLKDGFYGSVPIVGATIPIATGAALALQKDGNCQIAVSYFGDGATEEGVFHESLNFASIKKLPILFVCENNLYSSHLDINLRQPSDRCSRFAEAHRIPFVTIDGNDVVGVSRTASKLIDYIRSGSGPAFIEAVTYRHRGHVGADANIDVGLRRKEADVKAWLERDPIHRLSASLIRQNFLQVQEYKSIQSRIEERVQHSIESARSASYPKAEALLDRVHIAHRPNPKEGF